MIFFTAISDFLLYVAVSFLAGSVILQFVPEHRKPFMEVSRRTLLIAALAIPVLSAAPVVQLIALLAESRGWATAASDVLTGFRSGRNYVTGAVIAFIWILAIRFRAPRLMQAVLLAATVMNIGYGSHAASIDPWPGFISHTVHLLALSLWAGVLLHIAWFMQSAENWRRFVGWFTPFAFASVVVLLVSGIAVMLLFVTPADYTDSWILPYGQLLLLKHISIIPLLLAAWINGMRSGKDMPDKLWLRLESILLLIVFLLTAFMSKLAPPHHINNTFRSEGPAPFAEWLSGPAYLPVRAVFALSPDGLLFVAVATGCLVLAGIGRKGPLWLLLALNIGFAVCFYTGLMLQMSF